MGGRAAPQGSPPASADPTDPTVPHEVRVRPPRPAVSLHLTGAPLVCLSFSPPGTGPSACLTCRPPLIKSRREPLPPQPVWTSLSPLDVAPWLARRPGQGHSGCSDRCRMEAPGAEGYLMHAISPPKSPPLWRCWSWIDGFRRSLQNGSEAYIKGSSRNCRITVDFSVPFLMHHWNASFHGNNDSRSWPSTHIKCDASFVWRSAGEPKAWRGRPSRGHTRLFGVPSEPHRETQRRKMAECKNCSKGDAAKKREKKAEKVNHIFHLQRRGKKRGNGINTKKKCT